MKLPFRKGKQADPPRPLDTDDYDALKNERQYAEEHGSINAIFKKMGRENLDDPFKRD